MCFFLVPSLLALMATAGAIRPESRVRPRVIICTDFPPLDVIPVKAPPGGRPDQRSDPDDLQSMVRFILYANEFDVEALIATSGTFANVARKQNIVDFLKVYGQAYPALAKADRRYPKPDKLLGKTWEGLSSAWGSPTVGGSYRPLPEILGEGKDTEASNAIIRVVDVKDSRPVWICFWGGPREAAQALWKVKQTRTSIEVDRFVSKMRLFLIAKQDSTADWLLDTFPDLFTIVSEKSYMGMFWNMVGTDPKLADSDWIDKNIRTGHGPLGAIYPKSGWDPAYPGQQEGDTPSFLYLLSSIRGFSNSEDPSQASWGGQFIQPDKRKRHWFDNAEGVGSVTRWRSQVQADFKKRLDLLLEQ